MIRMGLAMMAAAAASVTLAAATAQQPQPPPNHVILPVNEIVWGPAPPSLPAGAQAAVLYGDPAMEGLFAMRLKVPKGFTIPPHTHPAPEIVTVISGVVRLGLGSRLDAKSARPLTAGSFYSTEPGTEHYVVVDRDAVLQVNSRGPWGIHYLNPSDDPRNRNQ